MSDTGNEKSNRQKPPKPEGRKSPKTDGRDITLGILLDMERSGRFSSQALEDGLRKIQFSDKEERAFITRLTEGVTETRIQLDGVLDHFAARPQEKQKPVIRTVLRMSVYQLLYMDGVPDWAVLSEAGRLLRKHHLDGMTGVVNGILRNVQRGIEEGRVEEIIRSSLTLCYSAPEELCEKLVSVYGKEKAEQILGAAFSERPLTVRVNRTRTDREGLAQHLKDAGLDVEKGLLSENALRIRGVDFVRKLPGFREGLFFVQDESSMSAVESLGDLTGKRVLDLCGAPGGKGTFAAELGGIVTIRDVAPEKIERIRENAERLGLLSGRIIRIEEGDARIPVPEDKEGYDVVIADVPCSGLGVMGKKNDIKYHFTGEGVKELCGIGAEILDAAALAVRPGGTLLFSTCTILPEENGEQAARFLEKHPGFIRREERQLIQGIDPCDGFYYCRMEKKA